MTAQNEPGAALERDPYDLSGVPKPRTDGTAPRTVAEVARRKMEASVAATLDEDGRPTAAYWRMLGIQANLQTTAQQSMRKMMLFFTVLAVIGLIAGLLIGIVAAVNLDQTVGATAYFNPLGLSAL